VRALRQSRGMDQVSFAKTLDISQGRLSKVERGQGKLSFDQWYAGRKAMAVGEPRELIADEDPWEGEQPLYVLALISSPDERLKLLPMLDGRIPIFRTSEAARFAMAIFEYTCTGNVCVLPIWPDFAERIAAQGTPTIGVPSPDTEDEDASLVIEYAQQRREVIDAAAGLAHAWLQYIEDIERWAERGGDDELEIIVGTNDEDPQGRLLILDDRGRRLWPTH
jgi:transcriptional regulator with XRE-family HTH domain